MARAQNLLAIGQAKEEIRLLQRDETEPGDKKSEPQQRHGWLRLTMSVERTYLIALRAEGLRLVQTLVEAAMLTKYPRPAMYRLCCPQPAPGLGDFACQ